MDRISVRDIVLFSDDSRSCEENGSVFARVHILYAFCLLHFPFPDVCVLLLLAMLSPIHICPHPSLRSDITQSLLIRLRTHTSMLDRLVLRAIQFVVCIYKLDTIKFR
jgi:hypothetical protein